MGHLATFYETVIIINLKIAIFTQQVLKNFQTQNDYF
jgi:hypothetical protein